MALLAACEVVVVGAGVAGLAATTALHRAGVDVVCVEARGRVGGRLLSVPADAGRLDLGATWFWVHEARVRQQVEALGIEVFAQHTGGAGLYDHLSGVLRVDGDSFGAASYRYRDGADAITNAMAAALPPSMVQLDRPVSTIMSEPAGLRVESPHGAWRSSQVILAVPPALALGTVDFQPRLPSELERLAKTTPVWMGATTKVVAHYRRPFWRDRGLAGAALSWIGPLRELHDMSGPNGQPAALLGFATQAAAEPILTQTAVVDQLVRLFGRSASHAEHIWVHGWRRERYTSPAAVETINDYHQFGHPRYQRPALEGRLHWSSTETATDSPGHVEGALSAAERAVHAVLTSLRTVP
jgi:monoamine oxidase